MNDKLSILIKNFNSYCVTLSTFMSSITSTFSIKIYRDEIIKLDKKQSNIIIDTFVLSILKYENHILEGNDSFFFRRIVQ